MIEPGTKLAHYEILAAIGKGGMGEVWRARDTKLGREVAIKTLPEEFASDQDRLARFEREAKLLASLNHPNIAAIHGFEQDAGTHFLVMELVEGDTLGDRLNRGALPVDEALKLSLQIADALKAAHEKGVIHRDLKPANIKVTDEGTIKVLDFGLAKAFAGEEAEVNPANSPTLSMQATQQGMILGTAAYMSPEQAKGRAVDKRADVWAFGCVLYEMLSGRQSFGASDVTESLAAVIRSEPEWKTLPANIHPRLRETVERCLAKQVSERFQDIGDVKAEIQRVLADSATGIVEPRAEVGEAPRQSKLPWVTAIVAGIVIAAAATWIVKPAPPEEPGQVLRFDYDLPDEQVFTSFGASRVDISRDGTRFAYIADSQLHVRDFDSMESRPVSGADPDPLQPVFSPDGQWIVYFVTNPARLRKLPVNGGTPLTIWELDSISIEVHWGTNDQLLYRTPEGVFQVDADGGAAEPEVLIPAEDGELLASPQLLPGENAILFAATLPEGGPNTPSNAAAISVYSFESGERSVIWPSGGSSVRYVSTGHIVYAIDNTLFALPFDLDTLEVTGTPVPVVEEVSRASFTRAANFGVSDNGTLLYVPGLGGGAAGTPLALVDRNGRGEVLDLPPGVYSVPRVSPDGERIAYMRDVDDTSDIWIYELSGANQPRQLTFGGVNRFPVWSADGERVAFQSTMDGDAAIFWQVATGTGVAERLTTPQEGTRHLPDSFSSDRQTMSFTLTEEGESAVWILDLESLEETLFAQETGMLIGQSVFSPDARWVAYQSNETGEDEVFVQPYPPTGARYQLPNTNDNHHPIWSPDGSELFYVPNAAQFAVVGVTTDPSFEFGNLLPIPGIVINAGGPTVKRNTDMMPDGERFITRSRVVADDGAAGTAQIRFVLNWFEELEERAPAED